MHETIIQSETVYDGRVVRLLLHDVRLPDGQMGRREIVQHPGAVALVALDEKQQVLLVRQFRLAANRIMLEVPAGTLEPGEDPLACARRELQEETGYRPAEIEALGGIYVAPGYTTEYIHLFLASGLHYEPLQGDADEFIELERVKLDEALAMIEDGRIEDGKTIAALLRVARRRA